MQIYIINGPNLHNIGNREPDTYGKFSFDEFLINLKKNLINIQFIIFNHTMKEKLYQKYIR